MLTLNGKYVTSDGVPASGTVTFAPVIAATNATLDAWVTTGPVTATLDGSGAFTVQLLASDDPTWSADDDIAYRVIEELTGVGRRTYLVTLPDPGPYDLHELQPEASAPTVTMVPVPGPGVATGGTTGQVLAKASDTDYDTEWVAPPGGAATLGDLTDVSETGADAGEALVSDGAGGWGPSAAVAMLVGDAPTAHAASHADGAADELEAADLAAGGAAAGHVLTADGAGGAAWEAPAAGAAALGDLTDVSETGADAGEALVSDGAGGWGPSTAAVVLTTDERLTMGPRPVVHDGTNWTDVQYGGAALSARPTMAAYPDAWIDFRSVDQISVTALPGWAANGDDWTPHPDAAI